MLRLGETLQLGRSQSSVAAPPVRQPRSEPGFRQRKAAAAATEAVASFVGASVRAVPPGRRH